MATRPSWEGFLAFNLISIPVKAYNAVAASDRVGFHLLHAKCMQRIRYKKVCPVHGEVDNDEIVTGHEVAKGEYVVVDKEEKDAIKDKDEKTIGVDTFIPPDAIDPIYFSCHTHYLVPSNAAARRPYAVLLEAMRGHDRHAVAQVVLSGKRQVAVVRPLGTLLCMTILNFEDQVKSPDAFDDDLGSASVSAAERKLAVALLESATSDEFKLSRYENDYAARMRKLIESKTKRKAGKKPAAAGGEVEDLMDALRRSLSVEQGRTRRSVKAKPTKKRAKSTAVRR